jgi:hypothetical protein
MYAPRSIQALITPMLIAKLVETFKEIVATSLKCDSVARRLTIYTTPDKEDGTTYIELKLFEDERQTVCIEVTIPKNVTIDSETRPYITYS